MLHACLYTICFVLCYTSWHFYAFSRTNLLTRRHSASSMFSAIFVFQKSTQEIFSELDKTKAEPHIFLDMRWSSMMRQREARGRTHPRAAQARPWPCHQGWAALVHLLMLPFRLYIPLDGKNQNARSIFHETYCKLSLSSTRDREGPDALPGTLYERGITTRGLLHHHGRLQSDVWLVYLGLWVHSSS
jgi:hypothetical protein